ncbi:MAG: DUF1501 domain-containing protein [Prochloraceae cyanobacterium]|nr:DUF1501 domain-containing protein [Prochloraceae cyanobacterium]
MKRRKIVQYGSLFAAASLISVGMNSWVVKAIAGSNNKKLIVIFLRGAIDGLNVVVPYRESAYYEARPTIAIPTPDDEGGAIDLDGRFGLNPALIDIMPFWQQNNLAFIHASGSTDPTRSHFEAQDYLETGTPGVKSTTSGWMNRLLTISPQNNPTRAVNVGNNMPLILKGNMAVANLNSANAKRQLPIDRSAINEAFDRLYSGQDAVSLAYQEGRKAREIVMKEINKEMMEADRGAPTPINFVKDARRLARLMAGDAKTQLGFMALGGWDTHVNQGSTRGRLTRNLKPLGMGLAALIKELGSVYQDTAIVVMSEFGRTVAENGNRGTDHGHGNAIWLLGGNIKGGKVYGEWPGLSESALYQGRDLAVTTDFRTAIASVLSQHLQLSGSDLENVFPGYSANRLLPLIT